MSRHLALFVDSLHGAGVQRSMLRLARCYVSRGYRVDLLVCEATGELANSVSDGVSLRALAPRSGWLPMARALRDSPSALARLARFRRRQHLGSFVDYLSTQRPDAVLAAGTAPNLIAVAGRRLARTDTRVLISQRTTLSDKVARATKRWKLPLVQALYPRADTIVAISRGVADDLARAAEIPRARIEVIYNPIVGAELFDCARAPVDHEWLQDDGAPVVLAVGRLKPRKDYPTMLRAFRRVRERIDARLVILGEGAERAALQRMVSSLGLSSSVELLGFVENPIAYMSRAALLVHSARWEGFGNVLVEALACGCPVVSTDCPNGPAEILAAGRYGALVPVGDDEALAGAVLDTLEKPPRRAMLSARAAEFSVAASADAYLAAAFDEGEAEDQSPKR